MLEKQGNFSVIREDVGLLDVLLALAENVKLLILAPVLVGLCALGVGFMLPPVYQSVAMLQADQATASLMVTASVLDPVIAGLGLAKDETLEDARRQLRAQIKTAIGRGDKLLTLTVSARTAQQAQAIAHAVLRQTYQESRPKGSVRTRLATQLAEAQVRLKNAQDAAAGLLKRLELNGSGANSVAEVARGYADLLSATGAAQTQISGLEAQLEGLSDSLLVQPPTLPERPSQPKKGLIAMGATLAAGLALLLFIFMRQAFRHMVEDRVAVEKCVRIRHALGLK
jgi:capsular polysaccharide biosynthesis protein